MGKHKDEWFEEYYGEYPEYSKPRWHTDEPDADKPREPGNSSTIAFRPWDEATVSDLLDGWYYADYDFDTPTEEVKSRMSTKDLAFDVYEIQDELFELLIRKHDDYGPKNISNAPGGPLNGLNVRMYDKLARLDNLISNNKDPKNESLRDTFLDLANYAIIGLLVLDGNWEK